MGSDPTEQAVLCACSLFKEAGILPISSLEQGGGLNPAPAPLSQAMEPWDFTFQKRAIGTAVQSAWGFMHTVPGYTHYVTFS